MSKAQRNGHGIVGIGRIQVHNSSSTLYDTLIKRLNCCYVFVRITFSVSLALSPPTTYLGILNEIHKGDFN